MLFVIMLILLLASNVEAHNDNAEIKQLLENIEQNKLLYQEETQTLINQLMAKGFNDRKLEGSVPTINTNCDKVNDANQAEVMRKYLIFVSFSMPSTLLKSLYHEANNNGGILLLRGLKNGSFKATAAYLQSLEIGVQIDPIAFKKYQVTRVPTIVALNNDNVITGNISFNYAKEQLLEAGK